MKKSTLLGAAALLSAPNVVAAQNPEPVAPTTGSAAAQPGDNQTIADIVVTAQRKSESVQKTPLAIVALSNDELATKQITDITALSGIIPNFQVAVAVGSPVVSMRGISLRQTTLNAEAPIALSVDGVFVVRPESFTNSFYDLDRIETVFGPQGTLYGRNATGGAINIITRNPTDELDGYMRMTVGNYQALNLEGAIGGPLSDRVDFRLAFQRQRHGPWGHIANGGPSNDLATEGYRGKIKYKLSDRASILIAAEYFHEDDATSTFNYLRDNAFGIPNLAINFGGVLLPPRDRYFSSNSNIPPRLIKRGRSVSSTINWDISDAVSLTSITNYSAPKNSFSQDMDSTQVDMTQTIQIAKSKTFTQETRLSGDFNNLNYVAGVFLLKDKSSFFVHAGLNSALFGGSDYLAQGIIGSGAQKTTALGIFAQIGYELTPWLGVDVGARYSWEKKTRIGNYFVFDVFSPYSTDLSNLPIVYQPDTFFTNKKFTPKVTIRVKPSQNINLYATYSEGFKSGAFDYGLTGAPYKPEFLKDIEGGIKADWLDGRLRTNLAVYHYDYTNLLSQVFDKGTAVVVNANAGSAKLYGIEAQIVARPLPQLQIDLSGAYSHARYKEFSSVNGADPAQPLSDLRGKHLPSAPDYTANAGIEYEFPTSFGSVSPRVEASYVSKVYFTQYNNAPESQSANTKIDAYIKFAAMDTRLTASLFVKNLTDKQTVSGLATGFPAMGAFVAGVGAPPRTYGMTVQYDF